LGKIFGPLGDAPEKFPLASNAGSGESKSFHQSAIVTQTTCFVTLFTMSSHPNVGDIMFKLYGVPLSQPFRAVAWTMLQLEIPFQVQVAVPGATSKIGTLHDEFRRLTPHQATHVPLLEIMDGNLTLSESPAILMYLCERQQQLQEHLSLYPSPSVAPYCKAQVDSYLHWHHDNTRQFCKLFREKIIPDPNHVVTNDDWHEMKRILTALETGWLKNGSPADNHSNYIGRSNHPTIADILCYEELIPLPCAIYYL
jgi:glutathione S-transferase